jgi:hypothetical protein
MDWQILVNIIPRFWPELFLCELRTIFMERTHRLTGTFILEAYI